METGRVGTETRRRREISQGRGHLSETGNRKMNSCNEQGKTALRQKSHRFLRQEPE